MSYARPIPLGHSLRDCDNFCLLFFFGGGRGGGSAVAQCLTRERGAVGLSLNGITVLGP